MYQVLESELDKIIKTGNASGIKYEDRPYG